MHSLSISSCLLLRFSPILAQHFTCIYFSALKYLVGFSFPHWTLIETTVETEAKPEVQGLSCSVCQVVLSKSVNAAPLAKLGRTGQTHALLVGIQNIGPLQRRTWRYLADLYVGLLFDPGITLWRNWSQRYSNKRYNVHTGQQVLVEKAGFLVEDTQLQCNHICISSVVGLFFVMASWLSACALVESHLSFSGVCLPS